ncbi:Na(+)/citrate cotransporter-like [Glandiceps talaboti]
MGNCRTVLNFFSVNRKLSYFLITPLLMSPLLFVEYEDEQDMKASKCAYVLIVMCTYMVTLALPLAAVGLMPIVLLPTMSIMSIGDVATHYLNDVHLLLMGVFILTTAVEKYQLHRRIALMALLLAGSDPKWLLLAVISTGGFLSMWIPNLPLVSMMLPILSSLVERFEQPVSDEDALLTHDEVCTKVKTHPRKTKQKKIGNEDINVELTESEQGSIGFRPHRGSDTRIGYNTNVVSDTTPSPLRTVFHTGLAYSTIIGGAGTLIGSGLQPFAVSIMESYYGPDARISFGSWMVFCCPVQMICLLLCWMWLTFLYILPKRCCSKKPLRSTHGQLFNQKREVKDKIDVTTLLRNEYDDLGPLQWAEYVILTMFMILVVVWFFEEPRFISGWSSIFEKGYVSSSCITVGMAILCFGIPDTKPSCRLENAGPYKPLLDWKYAQSKVNWGLLLIIGGLQAVTRALMVTGLAAIIAKQFEIIQVWPAWIVLVAVTTAGTVLTEFFSPVMILTVMMPVLQAVGYTQNIHPWYFFVPVTLGLNLCFCLPAGNFINAMMVGNNDVTISGLVKSGILMNILCLVITNIAMNTYGQWVLQLDSLPDWAMRANVTTTAITDMDSSTLFPTPLVD